MAYQVLEKLHKLHDGYRKVVRVGQQEVILIQEQGQVYIISNRCTHMDAPLQSGTIQNGYIRCPLHGVEFSLKDGCSKIPGPLKPIRHFPPVYEGNTIGIEISPDDGNGFE